MILLNSRVGRLIPLAFFSNFLLERSKDSAKNNIPFSENVINFNWVSIGVKNFAKHFKVFLNLRKNESNPLLPILSSDSVENPLDKIC